MSKFGAEWLSSQQYNSLKLNYLYDISPEMADILSHFKGKYIELNGLTEISELVASKLLKYNGSIELNGLYSINENVSEVLSNFNYSLSLDGIAFLTDNNAKHLSLKKEGDLYLRGLISLTNIQAEYLSKFNGKLNIRGLSQDQQIRYRFKGSYTYNTKHCCFRHNYFYTS
jgi:hypothetical protein